MIDLALGETDRAVLDMIDRLLEQVADSDRAAAGFDGGRWPSLVDLLPIPVGLVEDYDQDGLSFLTLALIAEKLGGKRHALFAIDHIVAMRLILLSGRPELIDGIMMPLALLTEDANGRAAPALAGAVAHAAVALRRDGRVEYLKLADDASVMPNLGDLPVAEIGARIRSRITLPIDAAGIKLAQAERRTLAAACLGGMTAAALGLAADYAKVRVQFGAAIGSFQAIAHGLADVRIATATIGILARKAAWARLAATSEFDLLSRMAFAHAAEAAARSIKYAMHVFGGYGATLEYPVQAYFRSAKTLTLACAEAGDDLQAIGREVLASHALPFPRSGAVA